jgi:hypothetical protein
VPSFDLSLVPISVVQSRLLLLVTCCSTFPLLCASPGQLSPLVCASPAWLFSALLYHSFSSPWLWLQLIFLLSLISSLQFYSYPCSSVPPDLLPQGPHSPCSLASPCLLHMSPDHYHVSLWHTVPWLSAVNCSFISGFLCKVSCWWLPLPYTAHLN